MTGVQRPRIVRDGSIVRTEGLLIVDHPELYASVRDPLLAGEVEKLIGSLADRIIRGALKIEPNRELAYGYWKIRAVSEKPKSLHFWELDPKGETLLPGIDLTLRYWTTQHQVCQQLGAQFAPPRPDQLVVVSAGVFDMEPVKAVRYPSPDHMSGWWMITDRYDGNMDSLRTEHLVHVTAERPDLAKYISLPVGYRFDLANTEDIWFDPAVLQQET